MRTLGIAIDGVVRDFVTQFDRVYKKAFIHNEGLVKANIPTHMEARTDGIKEDDFTAIEQSDEEILNMQKEIDELEKQYIYSPVTSENLLNHYRFDAQEDKFLNSLEDQRNGKGEYETIKITPKEVMNKFIYEDHPFQIFAKAPEYDGAVELCNKIQGLGLNNKWFKTVLICKGYGPIVPATHSFLGLHHSRVRNLVFVDSDEEKWTHCDVLIDASSRAIQSVPEDKHIIRIEREWNKYDQIDFTYQDLNGVYKMGILEKLLKPTKK